MRGTLLGAHDVAGHTQVSAAQGRRQAGFLRSLIAIFLFLIGDFIMFSSPR